jgi:hypothetical protein
MTLKEVASVIDDINEWQGPHGSIFYVTAIFTDESVGSVGRKDHDAALEVQGLLREAIGQELDFTLEPKGQTKSGREKFNIKGFGIPGGAATYTAPGVQGDGGARPVGPVGGAARARSPEPSSEQAFRTPADFRAEKALEAAVDACHGLDINAILEYADAFNAWMLEKTSEPALREYPQPVVAAPNEPSTDHQPGASSEDSSAGELGPSPSAPADSEGGVATKGKEPAPPSHEPGHPGPIETVRLTDRTHPLYRPSKDEAHEHDWYSRQGVPKFLVCDCGATRKKEVPQTTGQV